MFILGVGELGEPMSGSQGVNSGRMKKKSDSGGESKLYGDDERSEAQSKI